MPYSSMHNLTPGKSRAVLETLVAGLTNTKPYLDTAALQSVTDFMVGALIRDVSEVEATAERLSLAGKQLELAAFTRSVVEWGKDQPGRSKRGFPKSEPPE